jgi:hypothetical protein
MFDMEVTCRNVLSYHVPLFANIRDKGWSYKMNSLKRGVHIQFYKIKWEMCHLRRQRQMTTQMKKIKN